MFLQESIYGTLYNISQYTTCIINYSVFHACSPVITICDIETVYGNRWRGPSTIFNFSIHIYNLDISLLKSQKVVCCIPITVNPLSHYKHILSPYNFYYDFYMRHGVFALISCISWSIIFVVSEN